MWAARTAALAQAKLQRDCENIRQGEISGLERGICGLVARCSRSAVSDTVIDRSPNVL